MQKVVFLVDASDDQSIHVDGCCEGQIVQKLMHISLEALGRVFFKPNGIRRSLKSPRVVMIAVFSCEPVSSKLC